MKFIVNSAYLLKQLSNINGVITTNPVVPILENFLFELEKGSLTVTASDLPNLDDHGASGRIKREREHCCPGPYPVGYLEKFTGTTGNVLD